LKSGVNSLNDTLSRAISGQKVSWQSFFQGLSQQFAKIGLEEAEMLLVRKVGGALGLPGLPGQQQQGQAGRAPWDEKLPGGSTAPGGVFGKIGGVLGLPGLGKRDGNSDATALIVQLTSGSVPLMPQTERPNTPLGKRDGSSPALALYVSVVNAMGQPQSPNGWQTAAGIVGALGPLAGAFGSSKGSAPTMVEGFQKRALGGDVNAGAAYLVGEQGPEILTGVTGRIATHSASQRMLGAGGPNIYYTIDARGTDPALTEQRTRQAIIAAHNSSVMTSLQASAERLRRTPPPKP
jgi:hypothetical protein